LAVTGHFFLTHLLYDTLKQSAPSRIMNTTAPAYQLAELDFDDINFETKEYVPSAAYAQSKLAVVYFTKEFAKRFPVEGRICYFVRRVELKICFAL
jgi:NAD(P)-dependent dehydrogenase (short-subunit alcohol dehydrogenase family)